jgi:Xaa-Pro aminopeptidase
MAKVKNIAPHPGRIKKLQAALKREKLNAMIVWSRTNTRYISGFTGSTSMIVVLPQRAVFFTDFRYFEVASKTIKGLKVIEQERGDGVKEAGEVLKRARAKRVGFEAACTYDLWNNMRETFDGMELVEASGLFTGLRIIKSGLEMSALRQAVKITDRVFSILCNEIKTGMTEAEIEWRIRLLHRELGASGESFAPIVAAGPNGSCCHHVPGDRPLQKGDLVIIDMGCIVDGYCSDMTRTIVMGKATAQQKKIYKIVKDAQERAVRAMTPGKAASKVDAVARNHITKHGYGKEFGHGLGHGTGLEIHESPFLNAKNTKLKLAPGMVSTCEPGIYIPGWGGIRVEDIVQITKNGPKILCTSTKELLEL